jgi:signal transduction histidine kinase
MSQLGGRPMLNSETSQLNTNNSHRVRSQKHQQIVTDKSFKKNILTTTYQQAVSKASQILEMPLAILSVFGETEKIQATVGLEVLALSTIDVSPQILGIQNCSQYLECHQQRLAITDVQMFGQYFDQNVLIKSYLGVPLLTRAGDCLGTLAVMDTETHTFSDQQQDMLEMIGYWLVCELERDMLLKAQVANFFNINDQNPNPELDQSLETATKFNLLTHLSQSLRTPLTAIVGMTSILQRELYGPLNEKQQSYTKIINHSGQQLVALVNEITNLGGLDQLDSKPVLKAVDIEMLCQQAIQDLETILKQRRQQVELVMTSKQRICLVDRDKVRQIIYYVLLSTLQKIDPNHRIQLQILTNPEQLIIEIQPIPVHNLRVLPNSNVPMIDITHAQLGLVLSHVLTERQHGSLTEINDHGYRLSLPLITGGTEER